MANTSSMGLLIRPAWLLSWQPRADFIIYRHYNRTDPTNHYGHFNQYDGAVMSDADKPTPLGPKRGQLSISRLLLIMALISVAAAVFGGLARGGVRQRTLLILALVAPMGVMIAMSLWVEWRRRRR